MELPHDDNLCLSLHVVGVSETEDPLPLNTIYASNCDLITDPIDSILDQDSPDPGRNTMQLPRSPRLGLGSGFSRKRKANAALGLGSSEGGNFSGRVLRSGKVVESTALRRIEGVVGSTSGKVLRSGKVDGLKSALTELGDNQEGKRMVVKGNATLSGKGKGKGKAFFLGEPIPDVEARDKWNWRYQLKDKRRKGQGWILNANEEDEIILNVECHYSQAKVGGCIFNIGECAFIKGDGKEKHVGRILEFFRTTENEDYFRVQWFYKAGDTVMKDMASFHDKKRLFYSTLENDNPLDCLISKVNVIRITREPGVQLNANQPKDFYYDMEYCVEYSTFRNLLTDNSVLRPAIKYTDTFHTTASTPSLEEDLSNCRSQKADFALLDLYAGCGGMSTGLCLGAELSSVKIVTKWAVDYQKSACDSLKLNHPETQVRNMPAEDFLELLKEWEKLCNLYALGFDDSGFNDSDTVESNISIESLEDVEVPSGEYEVSSFVDMSYGTISKSGKQGLKFKVRWKGYDSSEDTWEPIEGLSNCQDHLKDFVRSGSKSKILPVPGDVDVICGGPPCQGISGYNRFRNVDAPLTDERNHQIVVFMDIVKFLKPRYVLMENVADILRFDKGSLGRYALSRMVHMKYQARLGIMPAGCYGLPQFRLRVFLWGALPSEKLPQFPLPTHDVVVKFAPPSEFEQNTVAYSEGQPRDLEEAAILRDAISDLPAVTSQETREEMTYEMHPETEFQKYIRSTKYEIAGYTSNDVPETKTRLLYDHRPYQLSEDDYLRVCMIPHRKGANFRDLPGVKVDQDNKVSRDLSKELEMLPSGKPLVPDYVFTFEKGKSKRPFARLWWDETVGTVVTFPSCHNMAVLHPEQDRVLTLREFARLQGFPDYYRFCGTVKERYCQVGNAVAVSVSRALGYALGMAFQKLDGDGPLLKLPPKFSYLVPQKTEKLTSED
ncbi:DNA (Cytosine-5)-methyltransferase CMT2 [Heracleum sosnowskyi]|uniref:Cytosine-specific methyltransferase n=1 Tax=Heracleum sosnowskyi TaxID=360622 RepID=A0AAD8I5X0_9APIA|nr:DNA (Cytosine-5)-methyltransferase CMT2 [Heracleum sosnowskyi]